MLPSASPRSTVSIRTNEIDRIPHDHPHHDPELPGIAVHTQTYSAAYELGVDAIEQAIEDAEPDTPARV
jgi:hypothetical protein